MLSNKMFHWRLDEENKILFLTFGSENQLHYSYKTICTMYDVIPSVKEIIEKKDVQYLMYLSRHKEVWNMGGDLELFVRCIKNKEFELLRDYAIKCAHIVHSLNSGYGSNAITISVIQGNAFGGGFESALSSNYMIAEDHVKFRFPEVIFGTFPGMGAYSLLTRKVGFSKAKEMIHSAKKWKASEMKDAGLIHEVCNQGEGIKLALEKITNEELHAHDTFSKICTTVPLDELISIVEIWIENVMNLDDLHIKTMQKLIGAQKYKSFDAASRLLTN